MPDLEIGRHALRSFKVIDDHLWPIAINNDSWSDGTCIAECIKGNTSGYVTIGTMTSVNGIVYTGGQIPDVPNKDALHVAPVLNCSCGIYGTLSLQHLHNQYPSYANEIVCVIAAEGSTILGSRGLRTAAARVIAYWAASKKTRNIAAKQFNSPVNEAIGYKRLNAMLTVYEIPVVDETLSNGGMDFSRYNPPGVAPLTKKKPEK